MIATRKRDYGTVGDQCATPQAAARKFFAGYVVINGSLTYSEQGRSFTLDH